MAAAPLTDHLPIDERNDIALAHLSLARNFAWRYYYKFGGERGLMSYDDWYQSMCVALLQAITVHTKDQPALLITQMRRLAVRDTIAPLFRRSTKGSHAGVSRMEMHKDTFTLSKTDERTHVAPEQFALLEAAMDVQTLMRDARPRERAVLSATLADAFLERGKVSKEDRQRGRCITSAECLAKKQWTRRQQKRLGLHAAA